MHRPLKKAKTKKPKARRGRPKKGERRPKKQRRLERQQNMSPAEMTAQRTTNCYDLMDAAYDAPEIRQHSRSLGHVPIIDINPRSNKALKQELADEKRRLKLLGHRQAEDLRYNERSTAERSNGRFKDEFCARDIWVRGNEKVFCHLMFGVFALTVDQLVRFVA